CLSVSMAFAAGTPAGTAITNFATGTYRDANGNALAPVTSNTVTTIVSQVAGVDISPASQSGNVLGGETVSFSLVVTNTGNGPDTYDLSKAIVETGGGVNTAEIYHDANGNGVLDAGETAVSTVSDLAADATYHLIVVITNVSGADESYATTTITATSQFNSSVSDAATLVSTVSLSVLSVTLTADNLTPTPGDVVTFTIYGENNGTALSKHVVITSPIGTNMTYVPGSMKIMSDVMTDAADADSADFNVSSANAVTFHWGDAGPGASGYLYYQAVVNDDVPAGTLIANSATVNFNNAAGTPQSPVSANATGATLTVAQFYAVLVGVDKTLSADPGDDIFYAVTVQNLGNGPDIFNISYINSLTTWELYLDHNANGVIDNGDVLLEDTNLDGMPDIGTMAQFEIDYLIAKATVPPGTNDGNVSTLVLKSTSAGDPAVFDEGQLTITVTAPVLSLNKAVSPSGNQPPGTILTYTVTILNSGTGMATVVVISDDIPTNTTFVPGSMKIGASSLTDASDADGGTFSGTTTTFELPQLGGGGSTTVSFQVVIN
ncbi:MAG: hypothetical protein WCS29_04595, partial [Candidatus Neomarinimicrobiota bacterium]